MRFKKGKTYKLWWWDIHHDSSWSDVEKATEWAHSIKPIILTGQEFLGMTKNFYLFTSGKAGDGDTYDITLMPRSVIHKAKEPALTKMEPGKKYRLRSQASTPQAPSASRTRPRAPSVPLSSISALENDLDTINSHIIQAVKHLHLAGDMTFDLARKLSIIRKDKCQDSK